MESVSQAEVSFFSKCVQNKIIRFFLSAGVAGLVDIFIYTMIINFVIYHQTVKIGTKQVSAHEFTLMISYTSGVIVNFFMTKFVVFTESTRRGRHQFVRFFSIAIIGFFASYGLLRFFVEYCHILPTFSRILTALVLGFLGYYVHKTFTFNVRNK